MTSTAPIDISDKSLRGRVSEEEWQVRVDLAAAYRLSDLHGWTTTLLGNHISARVPGTEDHFLLNPWGLLWSEVTASNLVKIDLDGNVLDGSEFKINRAGYTIHSAIHGARPDVGCILHTHTEAGLTVASLEGGLMLTNQDALMFHDRIAYHDFEGIALNLDERKRLVADLGDKKVMLLRNHGLLTTGTTIGGAWVAMYFLEKACSSQLKLLAAAAASGQKIIELSDEVIEHTAAQYGKGEMGPTWWNAMVRQLDAVTTDYKR